MVLIRPNMRLLVALAVAVIALASGCGDDDTPSTSSTTASAPSSVVESSTSASSTTVDPEAALHAEIMAAYDDAVAAFLEAAAIPDENHPAIAATHTGPMLDNRQQGLLELRAQGQVIRYPPDTLFRQELIEGTMSVDGDVAIFEACAVDDGETIVAATGEVVGGGVVTVRETVAMQLVDGQWRLAERRFDERWEGVAGCAADWD